jgi:hypothetical protein
MIAVHYLLLTDGDSDRVLQPILEMTMRTIDPALTVTGELVDRRVLSLRKARSLADRVAVALEQYEYPDILFIHRDAENQDPTTRLQEIRNAVDACANLAPWVPVVPVRMQEAWLLLDESAIRSGSGNPNGRTELDMPPIGSIERIPDPKARLHDLLRDASGLAGRRRKEYHVRTAANRVVGFLGGIEPLRQLPAFRRFETDLRAALGELGA